MSVGSRVKPVKCSVDGCVTFAHARSLCLKHYQRSRRSGDPLPPTKRRPYGIRAKRGRQRNGAGHLNKVGYRERRAGGRSQLEHRLIAERVIGKTLPKGAVVHHMDGNKSNNAHSNLVVCPNQAYHKLLHRRADFLRAYTNGFADGIASVVNREE